MSSPSARGRPRARAFVLGDSISKHYFPFLQECLRGAFVLSKNEEAGDSSLVITVLKKLMAEGGPDADVLLVNCGLHDIKTPLAGGSKQVPLGQYRRNLKEIIALARKTRAEMVWVRTTPVDDATHNRRRGMEFHRFAADVAAYNRAADRIMKAAGVPMIDLYAFTLTQGPKLYMDHVHYRMEIRRRQAAFLAGWLTAWRDGADGTDKARTRRRIRRDAQERVARVRRMLDGDTGVTRRSAR